MTLNHLDQDFFNEDKNPHYGATCGRVAGRIANAKFSLDNGKTCELTANNGPNSLHGGLKGFSRVYWDKAEEVNNVEMMRENFGRCMAHGVKFSRVSKNGEENFPGEVNVEQYYCITDENELYMMMKASLADGQPADTQTPFNMCNHAYWNLSGDFAESTVGNHSLSLPTCDRLIELGEGQMPTGNLPEVKNDKRFEFTEGFSKIGERERLTGAIDGGGQPGIDHPFALTGADLDALNPKKMHIAAHLQGGSTEMSVYTT